MSLDKQSPIPLHHQLKEMIEASIRSNELKIGHQVPTEEELAKQHEVSRGTVRQAILALTEKGYLRRNRGKGTTVVSSVPHKGEKGGVKNAVAMLVPYFRQCNPAIVSGAENRCKRDGVELVIVNTEESAVKEIDHIERLMQIGIQGMLIYTKQTQAHHEGIRLLTAAAIPFVLVDRFVRGLPCCHVVSDNVTGGYLVTRHLIDSGHERIAFLSPTPEIPTSIEDRVEGYKKALSEAGIPRDPALVKLAHAGERQTSWNEYRGLVRQALHDLLALSRRPTAIFCSNYLGSMEAIAELDRLELKVPEEMAVAGFDDDEMAEYAKVPLTTVAQDFHEMGEKGADILISEIHGKRVEKRQVLLPVTLITRASSGAVAAGSGSHVAAPADTE